MRAYPRIRGGNGDELIDTLNKEGLSPHTRGKPAPIGAKAATSGPIPAYAGETWPPRLRRRWFWAYPRIRGGNVTCSAISPRRRGLSPHTRGKPNQRARAWGQWGPIPAYAGETHPAPVGVGEHGAYPRIRGGNFVRQFLRRLAGGLSPHTRGKRRAGWW